MLNRFKHSKIIKIAACLFVMTTAIFLSANFVLAASLDTGINYAEGTGLSKAVDIRIIIAQIIRIALGFLGIIAVGLIIYAGWLWLTSAGNEEKIERAKKILQNAVIGLIIILSAFAIASFILSRLIGAATGGGQNGPGNGPPTYYGLSALGNGIIESHYPARGQKEVPRNISIIITFREPMLASTLCATADTAIGARCAGEAINKNIIRIFKKSQEAVCVAGTSPSLDCSSLVADVKVYSTDGKTFVFAPNSYFGSPSEYIDYTVYLGNGLLKQSGGKAFPGLERDYGWSFEVSNKIDLTPPQVKPNGVFPPPDGADDNNNAKDITAPVSGAAPASGTITVNSRPLIYSDASVLSVDKPAGATYSDVSATVDRNCGQSGALTVNVDSDNKGIIKLKDSSGALLGQGVISGKTAAFALCNLKLTIGSGDFAVGNLWTVTVKAMTAADTITVGGVTYIASGATGGADFKAEPMNPATAQNLVTVLANNPEITASRLGSVVTVKAKIAGLAGNNINLSSSNPAALEIRPMAGGAEREDRVTVNGRKDQPMNTAIQINFNEAIMPLTVSGTSDEVKNFIKIINADAKAKAPGGACSADADCKSFSCLSGVCDGVNDYLKGKFTVSNQYGTVEFLSDKECGFNTCGEKIYCLPANSHLKIGLRAANLISCANNNDCRDKSPFNICDLTREICWDGNKYFPQAAKIYSNIVNGLVDAAFNSLDGNRDGSAYGPVSYYNENTPAAADGDSYKWSFFISQALDLTPPKIKTTAPVTNGAEVGLINAIRIGFDKLMLSSRLTTGSLTIQNGDKNILHYLLNLRSFVDQPLGYWVTNVGRQTVAGGEIDSTEVSINHSPFGKALTYTAQAGSGLKDIYQNCYLPCSSESLAGTPSCCNGQPTARESCP